MLTTAYGDEVLTRLRGTRVALGTMYFGTTVDEATSRAILDRFAERGGRVVDTANCYAFWAPGGTGEESELLIGRWLADTGARDEVLLTSKVGCLPDPLDGPFPESAEGLDPSVIHKQFALSAERLGTDRIDVYLTHGDDPKTPLEQSAGALSELVRDGRVGVIGASNSDPETLRGNAELAASSDGIAPARVIQVRHSYLWPDPSFDIRPQRPLNAEMVAHAREHGIVLQGYSPLLQGALTKPDKELSPEYRDEVNERRLAHLREQAERLGVTANQLSLAWMAGAGAGFPVMPVLGVSSVAQLDEALDGIELELPAEVRAALDAQAPLGAL
ncbi:aldo/keto reductase [Actinosynnema pretiosum]|uniref:Oxidoreductase n=1 Tax=Actinosynnema pretiosum TaxID=42197 RepID=A0A290Z2Q9_9PSEU|nr:aldo/keto reductase [Actinosynnema pretiosum]ATE53255.1 oxidoreductase [Actinosynnema pretiosum]